jgi:WD40 repeat protein
MRLQNRALLALAVFALTVLLAAAPALCAPPEAPILRIETGMHTAPIQSLDVDAAGRFLVTGSYDKTVRVWDLASGELLRVLRPPVGEGDEGKVYAVAITPGGELVAAGGWTSQSGQQESIYLFDRRTGLLVRRIAGLPHRVMHLAFSPDGRRLAATLGGANGLRVFRSADGVELFRDTELEGDGYWADFDSAGRLVTSNWDGRLRLYGSDGHRIAVAEAPGGRSPLGVAFSPGGRQIAVGYDDSTRVDVLSGEDLHLLFSADTAGTNTGLSKVAWSIDGAFLFAAGRYDLGGNNPIRRWSRSGRGPAEDLPGPLNTVMGLRPLPGGRLVFGSADPAWGVLAASGAHGAHGAHALDRGPAQADPRGLLDGFLVDLRGERIRFAYESGGRRPAIFSLRDRRLVPDPPAGDRFEGEILATPRLAAPGLEITGWQNTAEPRRNGEALPLRGDEASRSLAIAADGQSFLLGTEWFLRAFRADGTELWPAKPSPGIARAVNLTADGRLALAAFGDGTIRWYRARDGAELLAFFPHGDGRRWVLWTPSGYYDASVDGEDLIGWHVNRGPDQAADFFPVSRFRDTYRRPDVIDLVLETLDEAEALRRAGVRGASPTSPAVLPPVVTILDPADGAAVSTPTVKLRVNVRSPSGARVDRLLISIDGRAVTTRDAVWAPSTPNTDARDFFEEREIPVPQRDCTIEVTAEAAGSSSQPVQRRLHWVAPAPKHERRAWVLAVGVSKYENPEYNLGLAAKDATDLAAAWKALEGHGFAKVETRVLTDAAATREAILDGFDWLSAVPAADDDDLMILFLAGHGINESNQYYFLPYDADPARRNRTFLSESQLYGVLRALPRRVVLFLDTCRAGSFATGQTDSELKVRVDPTGFVNSMASNARVLVFSATASRQLSQESPDWGHGAFTKALIDALTAANREQRKLTTTDLERYLYDTVSAMTGQAQTPTVAKAGLPDIVLVPGSR